MTLDDTTLYVHALTAGQYRRLVAFIQDKRDLVKADFLLLHYSVKDADGKCAFNTPEEAEDLTPQQFDALLPVCVQANGFGTEAEKKSPSEPTPSN